MMKIAIFSPEHRKECELIRACMESACHEHVIHEDSGELMKAVLDAQYDLLILNVKANELKPLLTALKRIAPMDAPVLALIDAAPEHADDLVACMTAGLTDYLVKPLRRKDLMLRTDTLLRRAWPEKMGHAHLRFGDYVFDTHFASVRHDDRRIELTRKEFELALLFFRHLNQPLSRATLLETLWTREKGATSRTVDTHVSRVRRKLGLQGKNPFRLEQVYGYGYVLEMDQAQHFSKLQA